MRNPLWVRLLAAADTIDELNTRNNLWPDMPWAPTELRREAITIGAQQGANA